MKRLLQLLLIAVISVPAIAQQLSPEEALGRVRSMSGTAGAKATQKNKSQLVYTMQADNTAQGNLLYVFSDESSFVIAGADGQLPALIAYGASAFPTDSIPDNLRSWLDNYKSAFSAALAQGVTLSSVQGTGTPVVAPLVTAKWGQSEPFWNKCLDIGEQSVTGCVATAMAQLMYYHKWPERGTGSHSYSYNLDFGGTEGEKVITPSADFSQHTYDWSNMQDAYGTYYKDDGTRTSMSYSNDQADGISTLLHDCGVAVDMLYAGGSSSASSANVPNALISYFGYDRGMRLERKEYYTDEEWKQLIRTELDARRPVLYSGQTTRNEGHAFVCDGYDDGDYFHINWGWQGMANGYFLIVGTDPLNPPVSGTGGGTVGYGYKDDNDVIIGIQKAQEGSEYNYSWYCSEPFTISPTKASSRVLVYINGGFYNGSAVTARFDVGMRFKHKTADYSVDVSCSSNKFAPNSGYSKYGQYLTPQYKGEYEVYPIFRLQGTEEWKVMKYNKSWTIPVFTYNAGQEPPASTEKTYYTVSITSEDNAKGTVSVEGVNSEGKAEKGSNVTATATPANGYEFEKWSDGSTVSPRTISVNDNITLKAQFSAKLYTLTYKVDGEEYQTKSVAYGTALTAIAEPTKEGYTFSGWSALPETMPAQDVTVTGSFTVNKYKVTYKVDGEVYKTVDAEYGTALTAIAGPTKEGYTFSGWDDLPETMPARDITITGTFEVNVYTLTYKVDGEVYQTEEIEYGSEIPEIEEPTKEGYTFSGWSALPETMPAQDVTVTGSFTVNKYKVTYKVDGEEYQTVDVEYNSALTALEEPTKEGYTFSGWSALPETMPAQDVTVTGSFTVNKYKVTYIYNGEIVNEVTLDYGNVIPDYKYVPTNPYHTFLGWRTEGYTTMPAKDLTFIADFTDGISNIDATAEGIRIYTVSGKRIDRMVKGTNIIVYPDGRRVKKVMK